METQRDLRALREERGYGQRAWSRLTGVSQAEISQLERARRKPQQRTLEAYARACQLPEVEIRAAASATQARFERYARPATPTDALVNEVGDLLVPQNEYQHAALASLMRSLSSRIWLSWVTEATIDWVVVEYNVTRRSKQIEAASGVATHGQDETAVLGRALVLEDFAVLRVLCRAADQRTAVEVEDALWHRSVFELVDATRARRLEDFEYLRDIVFAGLLTQARDHSDSFERARERFIMAFHELLRAELKASEVHPVTYRLSATEHALSGVSDGLRRYARLQLDDQLMDEDKDPLVSVPIRLDDDGVIEYIRAAPSERTLVLTAR